MAEVAEAQKETPARLKQISEGLRRLLGLRAALTSFQLSLHALEGQVEEPEGRRRLLALWRPCQERLDRLLDVLPPSTRWAGQIGLLRQEMEDSLIDEAYISGALSELTAAFDQACEEALFQLSGDLEQAVGQLGRESSSDGAETLTEAENVDE